MSLPAQALVATDQQRLAAERSLVAGPWFVRAAVPGLGSLLQIPSVPAGEKALPKEVRWLGPRGFALLMISIGIVLSRYGHLAAPARHEENEGSLSGGSILARHGACWADLHPGNFRFGGGDFRQ